MKVLFDTNIILDVLLNREPFKADSAKAMSLVEKRELEGFLCATSVTNIYYIVARQYDKSHAKHRIDSLLKIFRVAAVTHLAIERASSSKFSDFEDAVQHESAVLVDADAIVTRNIKDYKAAQLTICTPTELLVMHASTKPSSN